MILPSSFHSERAVGTRIDTSALRTQLYTPSDTNYGASVYREALLDDGLDVLYSAHDKWRTYRVARMTVAQVKTLGQGATLVVVASPQDGRVPAIAHAHASILGLEDISRAALLELADRNLVDVPPN